MTTNFKPFNRDEAFQLLSQLICLGVHIEAAIPAAIDYAQRFQKEMGKHAETVPFPKAVALQTYGQYCPHGTLLYFQTYDGAKFLVAEFESIQECVAVALAKNSFNPRNVWGTR